MPSIPWRLFWSYSGAFLAVLTGLIGLVTFLEPTFFSSVIWQVWVCVTALLLYLVGIAVVLIVHYRNSTAQGDTAGAEQLYEALLALVRQALESKEYREVVRMGDALSRPLFESGEFVARLELGKLTEEAAAHLDAKDVQCRSLIDSIGWSLIELGDFEAALKAIRHGLELAEELDDHFNRAKAYRHMGAIARRRGRTDDARSLYANAQLAAQSIQNEQQSREMEAGITYAVAHLEYSSRSYGDALQSVELSVQRFTELGDIYRVDMARVLKADIQAADGKRDSAKDTYRSVIQSSRQNRESVHYTRAAIGLAELHIADKQLAEAARALGQLKPEHVLSMPAFADRFRSAQSALTSK